MKFDNQTYRITDKGRFGKTALIIGLCGLLLSLIGYFSNAEQFFHSYLTAFVFWTTIGLGGLFFTMLNYLVSARWAIVLRRFGESLMMTLPVMAVLFIPIIPGLRELYHWSVPDIVAADHLLQGKAGYLNTTFFIIRAVIYFAAWSILALVLYKTSLRQDSSPELSQIKRMRIISAPGMILFAITITFAAFDWLMSLDAHWYSTIFGVYVFAGAFLAMLSLVSFIAIRLRKNNVLYDIITREHDHDLGKLIFAFTVFWGYMAFSQYFLIWYGNIPEETVWFLHRWEGSWRAVTLLIVFGHFAIPFFFLFPHAPKRNWTAMTIITLWILLMHWVDIYWLVMPSLHHHGVHLSWMDPTAMIGIGGIFLYTFWFRFTSNPLVPSGDPGLKESIKFLNK